MAEAPQGSEWDARSAHKRIGATTNMRDLGGAPIRGGGEVARGKFFRAEALLHPGASSVHATFLDEHEAEYRALAIKTVIDLRSAREQEEAPTAWTVSSGAALKSIPISAGVDGDTAFFTRIKTGELTEFSADDMADYYAAMLRECGPELGAALRVIADPDNLPVLVHCASGKDRTGLVAALLLEVLGVERHHVVAEYGLTELLQPNRVMDFAPMLEEAGVDPARIAVLFQSPPAAMVKVLDGLDAEFGSVTEFVTSACEVPVELIEELRTTAISRDAS